MGTFLGSHAPPRRPPERQGVPFGRIWGAFWGHFLVIVGAKMTSETVPKKMRFLRMDFGTCWWFWGLIFDTFLASFVFGDDCQRQRRTCVFCRQLCVFEGFSGSTGDRTPTNLSKTDVVGHAVFRTTFWVTFLSFLGHILEHFRAPKLTKLVPEKQQKTRVHF